VTGKIIHHPLGVGFEQASSATAYAVDFGAQFDLPTPTPVTVGASVLNYGTRVQFKDAYQSDPLPRKFHAGASVVALDEPGQRLTLSAEIVAAIDKLSQNRDDVDFVDTVADRMFLGENDPSSSYAGMTSDEVGDQLVKQRGAGIHAFGWERLERSLGAEYTIADMFKIRVGYKKFDSASEPPGTLGLPERITYGFGIDLDSIGIPVRADYANAIWGAGGPLLERVSSFSVSLMFPSILAMPPMLVKAEEPTSEDPPEVPTQTPPAVVADNLSGSVQGDGSTVANAEPPIPPPVAEAQIVPPPIDSALAPVQALLVGINTYDHHADLVNPVRDIRAVEKELREAYSVRTHMLIDATREEFRTALFNLAKQTYEENEQLFVFFSGHGWFDEELKRGYLALRDTKPIDADPLRDSFVSHEEVRTILERLDCRHVLLAIDSCFSGTLDPIVAMAPSARPLGGDPYTEVSRSEYIQRKLAFRTRRYITAGGKEYVPDGRPGQHSPFARQFLAALRNYGGADSILTLEELLLYLERVDPQPRSGELYGNEPGSSFVLVANPTPMPSSPPEDVGETQLTINVSPADSEIVLSPVDQRSKTLRGVQQIGAGAARRTFLVAPGRYRLQITRVGYQTVDQVVEVTEEPHTVDMVLSPNADSP
jgi:hypothetical protein